MKVLKVFQILKYGNCPEKSWISFRKSNKQSTEIILFGPCIAINLLVVGVLEHFGLEGVGLIAAKILQIEQICYFQQKEYQI